MDIIYIERNKRIIQCAIKSIPKKIKSLNEQDCYKFLMAHPTKEVRELTEIITKAANYVKADYQRSLIKHLTYVGLSACCRNKQYAELLSNLLSVIKGKRIDVKVVNEFSRLEMIIVRLLMKTAYRIAQEKPKFTNLMSQLLDSCNNDVVSLIHDVVSEDVSKRFNEKEKEMLLYFFDLGLYVVYQDTAYRDEFFWVLDKYSRPEIRKVIKPFVKPPSKWYPNVWIHSREVSNELKQKGVIPPYEHSIVERKMVPRKHAADLAKKLKEMNKYA